MMYLGSDPVGINNDEAEQYIQALSRTITHLSSSRITTLGYMAFSSCTELTYVSLPNLTSCTGGYVFNNCPKISYVYLPNLITTPNAFLNSPLLETLVLPKVNGLGNSAIQCPNLRAIDIGGIEGQISAGNFSNDTALKIIVLRRNTVVPLQRLNEMETTPFGANGSGGTLYVPQSLITAYQEANQWSTLLSYSNNQILSIENSIYNNKYVDGISIN